MSYEIINFACFQIQIVFIELGNSDYENCFQNIKKPYFCFAWSSVINLEIFTDSWVCTNFLVLYAYCIDKRLGNSYRATHEFSL